MPFTRSTSLGFATTMVSPAYFGSPTSALVHTPDAPSLSTDHLNNIDGSRVVSQLPSVTDFGGSRSTGQFPPAPATMSSTGAATLVDCETDRRLAPPSRNTRLLSSARRVPPQHSSASLGSSIRRMEEERAAQQESSRWCHPKQAAREVGRKLRGIFHFGTQTKGFVVHKVPTTAPSAVRPLSPVLRSSFRSSMRSRRLPATRMTSPARAPHPAIRTSNMTDSQPSIVETSPQGTRTDVHTSSNAGSTNGRRLTMFQGQYIVTSATTDSETALDALEGRTPHVAAVAEDNGRLYFDRGEPETLSTPRHSKQPMARADSRIVETTAIETSDPGAESLKDVLPPHIQPSQTFYSLFGFLSTLPVEQQNDKVMIQSLANAPAYKNDEACQWFCAEIVADIGKTPSPPQPSAPTRPDPKRANTLPPDNLPFITAIPPMSPFPETSAWDRSSLAGTGTLFRVRQQLATEAAKEMNAVPSPIPASLRPGSQIFPQPAPRPASRPAASGALPYPATPAGAQPIPRPGPNPAPRPHTYADPSSGLGYIPWNGNFEPYGPATPVKAGAEQPSRRSSTDSLGAYFKNASRAEQRKTINKIESVILTPVVAQMPRPANPQPSSMYSVAVPTPSAFGGIHFRDSAAASAGAPAPRFVPAPVAQSSQQAHRRSVPRKVVASSSKPRQHAQPVSAPSPAAVKNLPAAPPPGHRNRFTSQATHPLRKSHVPTDVEQPRHTGALHYGQAQQSRAAEAQQRRQAAIEAPCGKKSKTAMIMAVFRGLLEVNDESGQKRKR